MNNQIEAFWGYESNAKKLIEIFSIDKDPVPLTTSPVHKGSFFITRVVNPGAYIRERFSGDHYNG
jgi:hypothetical protein